MFYVIVKCLNFVLYFLKFYMAIFNLMAKLKLK